MNDLTGILHRAQQGDPTAPDELLPLVYEELRRLAAAKMVGQPPGHTLQATALVHEAWLKLAGTPSKSWADREHFFRAAATAMRQILIDRARKKRRAKHGGHADRVKLEEIEVATDAEPETLLLIDEALSALARTHPEKAEFVKLRFYLGLTVEEAAVTLGVSERTAKRHWTYARAWLFREINTLLNASY